MVSKPVPETGVLIEILCGLSQSAVKAKFCSGVQLVHSYTRT